MSEIRIINVMCRFTVLGRSKLSNRTASLFILRFRFGQSGEGDFGGRDSCEGEAVVYMLLTKSYRPRSERAALLFVSD